MALATRDVYDLVLVVPHQASAVDDILMSTHPRVDPFFPRSNLQAKKVPRAA